MVTRTTSHVNRFRLKKTAAVALLLFSTLSASALTIGRIRGAAWLGQPLDANVQVQIDGEQGLAALCFEAEVFHGDIRQEAGRVRVTAESGSQPQTAQVRIQSSAIVDEPVVTVYLRETCLSKTSRRFVLLSEIPPEALVATPLPAVPTVPAAAAPVVAKAAQAPAAATPPVARETAPPQPVQLRPPRPPKPAAAPAAPKMAASGAPAAVAGGRKSETSVKPAPVAQPAVAKPKLKLDPVESLSERVAQLEVAAAQPAPVASAEAQRLQKLEQNLQNLLSLAAKNERGMAELRERLQQAEAEKYNNGLVYGLAGLLLAALGGSAYLWRRQRQTQTAGDAGEAAWWDERERAQPPAVVTPMPAAASVAVAAPVVTAAAETAPEGVFVPVPAAPRQEDAPAPQTQAQVPVEINLDDLLAVGAEAAVPPDMNAVAGTDEIPVVDFPSLPEMESSSSGAGMADFPAAGEVHIDISHLSLSPVDEPMAQPQEPPPAAPLLDFDLPGLDKPAGAPQAAQDKGDPTAKT